MSEVWIRADEGALGSIPARCAKRGERCINRVRLESSDLTGPVEWVTWSGLWPRTRQQEPLAVVVSLLPRVATVHRVLARTRDVTTVLVVALTLLALPTDGLLMRAALLGALVALLVKLGTALIGAVWAVDVRADVTGEWLFLSHLHPDFVAAAEAATTRPETTPLLALPAEQEPSSGQSATSKSQTAASDGP